MRSRRCVVIAPFDPTERNDATGLGATRKIAGVVRMFCDQGWQVVVVDSAHSHEGKRSTLVRRLKVDDSRSVALISPATSAKRSLGKLLQLFVAGAFARRLARHRCDLVWIYNGYAFEALFARAFLGRCRAPLVVELEDWPLARSRGWRGVKNLLDWIGLRWSLGRAAIVTCVNDALAGRPGVGSKALSFPGLVEVSGKDCKEPFKNDSVRLGYFGGLHPEKGAHLLLELVPRLRSGWKMVVTGDGPLAEDFRYAAVAHPEKLEFHGIVPGEAIEKLQRGCDAYLNPHRSIAAMGDGVFPFKVFEYLSHSRPVISTALPAVTPDVRPAILLIEPTLQSLEAAVRGLPAFWSQHHDEIRNVCREVRTHFTRSAVYARIIARLGLKSAE